MIEVCLIIIAFSELVRVIFLAFDVARIRHDSQAKDNLYAEFIKSIRSSDKEFVKELLKQFEEEHKEVDEHDCDTCRYSGESYECEPCISCNDGGKWEVNRGDEQE